MTNAERSSSRCLLALLLCLALRPAPASEPLTLKRIMADPDWIGAPVEAAWWSLTDPAYFYRIKRPGSQVRDVVRVSLIDGSESVLDASGKAASDAPAPVYDRERRRALMIREGGLFVRELSTGRRTPLLGGDARVDRAQFSSDGTEVQFRAGGTWFRIGLDASGLAPAVELRFEEDPLAVPDDALASDQLRLFETLARERERRRELHREAIAEAAADPARPAPPWYMGDDFEPIESALSTDGRWLLLTVEDSDRSAGPPDRMPRFVTPSGYVEIEDVRTLVGRKPPLNQSLWLLDLANRERHEIDLTGLPGRADDPLAELKVEQDLEPHDADDPRPVTIENLHWHPDGRLALMQVHAIDNKDRWTIVLDAQDRDVETVHRLTDPAWINWSFNETGWVPNSQRIWLLSEETGYSQLYVASRNGSVRPISSGEFEVFDVSLAPDGSSALVVSNRAHPTEQDLYRISLANGRMQRLTTLKGVETYAVHPDGDEILIRYSAPYLPPQAAVIGADGGTPRRGTDTRKEPYRAIEWQAPQFVPVPSLNGAGGPIWSKFYPARGDRDGPRPAVLFVHGAGYTQNTRYRFPYYFREQMFHNLLTERGYHVLDMDYRASRGYGRDWRTAIYRRMGEPELEDLIDGVRWLVENHGADPDRVGIYGGSYGGFMALMAMFRAPEVFAAGAALRPVTDWRHYNHPYTSNILNTADVDPEAHERSSPIEFVEGLEGALLISHGMLDDNVFYKDSVRLVQRLIELEKTDWEFASYPLEPHGYEQPESWLDQYRRIFDLFEEWIGSAD